MSRSLGVHHVLSLAVAAAMAAAPCASSAQTMSVPEGSGIVAMGVHPPKTGEGRPLVEHLPLKNHLNFEVQFRTTSTPVTVTGGSVEYFDAHGNPLLPPVPFDAATFAARAVPSGAAIAENTIVIMFFPFDELPLNVVPSAVAVHLCFQEFGGSGGNCDDPLSFEDIVVSEYMARPAPTYIYPFMNPERFTSGRWFTAHGHELGQAHRGSLRWLGPYNSSVWVNQRYAYDFGVKWNDVDRACGDDECTNAEWFSWNEPLVATGDGVVVGLLKGMVDNAKPGATHPELCDQNGQPAGCKNFCGCGGADIGVAPPVFDNCLYGSGNTVIIDHGNGEYSWYAHMQNGSNDGLSIGDVVTRGQMVGRVGNSGASGGPHLHFALMDGPDPECSDNVPFYASNIEFISPSHFIPRRQLDVSLRTPTILTDILPAPTPLLANQPLQGNTEQEPNNTLAEHNTISVPATVSAILEGFPVGDLAVRGDSIEDVFRVDLAGPASLRFDLDGAGSGENLDLYVLTEELGVLNPTGQGTSPGAVERVCLDLGPGAYYAMATNTDQTLAPSAPYTLSVTSDAQSIEVEIEQGAETAAVNASCQSTVSFSVTIHDPCCLDPQNLALQVTPTIVGGNATVGGVNLNAPEVLSPTDVRVTGTVVVSNLTSCPAVLRIDATAQDCQGNVVDTADAGGEDTIDVIDATPPQVTTSAATPLLWSPNHDLVDVGFSATVADNCDANVAGSLATTGWSDEAEHANGHAPDAADLQGALRLRAERSPERDGRVYLAVSRAADSCGNTAFACTSIGVPRARSDGSAALVEAAMTQATAACEAQGGAPPAGFFPQGQSSPVGPKQ